MSLSSSVQEKHEDYMKRRLKEKETNRPSIEQQIREIRNDIKQLQIDIAYMMKKNG